MANAPKEWRETKWGTLAALEYGKGLRDYDETSSEEKPFRVFGTNGPIGWHSAPLCSSAGVVVGRKGAYRGIHFSPEPFFVIDTAFYLRPKVEFDVRWAYFQLKNFDINKVDSGSAIPSTSREAFYEIPVSLPPYPVQRRIAEILSSYDDLIKNNSRRIEILEQMVQMLCREWFVNFRFPGREKFSLVGSILGDIPEGWVISDLERVCVERNGIQTGPFGSQLHMADYSDEGVPVVMPKDLIGFRIRTDEIARIPESIAEKLSRHRMQPNDIVYGRRGDIGRRAFLMPDQAGWFCGTGCLRIRPHSQAVNGWYLFNYLGQDDVQGIIRGRALGVTMPNLNTGVMASVPVKLPPRDLQDAFARLTFPMAEAREVLTAAIENLRRTRDLLLPKLVSGEVSVQQIESEAAAQTV